jgi:hypothetical protein
MLPRVVALPLLAALLLVAQPAGAARKTVCTITVNSSDERELFKQRLPQGEFDFVELVERGRPDWLASACRKGVRCDVLVVSGHFDGGTEFYSDRLDVRESLPVAELERASCSESCPGVFSQLKEVYLFGCNTLNGEAMRSTSAEIGRSLLRAGHSPADAERITRLLGEQHAGSNRDRMRSIFKDVPVVYGFSSKAPLGPYAAATLDKYFKIAPASEFGSGQPSAKLVGLFAPVSMTTTSGVTAGDPLATHRAEVCRFSDDRLGTAQKVGFMHAILQRDAAEVRMFLDDLERYAASMDAATRREPEVAAALDAIARDAPARARYIDFVRDADQPAIRARMIELAGTFGWLTPVEQRAELIRMIGDELARNAVSAAEVSLACALNRNDALAPELTKLSLSSAQAGRVPNAALLACLGSAEARARVLRALTSTDDDDVKMAQVYLHHRPIDDAAELRGVTTGIVRMSGSSDAQVRALDTLARHPMSDRASLDELVGLYPRTRSVGVQRAIAGILLRSDYASMPRAELLQTLRQYRLRSTEGPDTIDVLMRRLQAPTG